MLYAVVIYIGSFFSSYCRVMKSTSVVGTWFMTMVISKLILGNVVTLLFLAPRCQKWKALLNNNSSLNAHHLRREEATRSGTQV